MKKLFLTVFLFGFSLLFNAQVVSVEKSTYGIQTGVLGIYFHNETKLSDQIALRSEIGLDSGIFGGTFYRETGYFFTPVFTLEPRWYYNLEKRLAKQKTINGNCGNFFSLKTSYNSNWFVVSNYDNLTVENQISIVPTWGIKRNINKHFTYEAGIGIGYRHIFYKDSQFHKNQDEVIPNIHLRIGYRF